MGVCTQEDDFTKEKLKWIATLSNGERVYQDDNRPGEEETVAWLRLKKYVNDNELSITNIHIQFFSHIEEAVPSNSLGYYFIRSVDAFAFAGDTNNTRHYYIFGSLKEDDRVEIRKWLVPEIIPVSTEMRNVEKDDRCLIINPNT